MEKITKLISALALVAGTAACGSNNSSQSPPLVTSVPTSYLCEVVGNTPPSDAAEPIPKKYPAPAISQAPRNHLRNAYDGKNLTVHFLTNSWALYDNDKHDIRAYLKSLPDGTNFVLEGYADFRGSIEDNLTLSENRADGVSDFLRMNGISRTSNTAYGEKGAQPKGTNIRRLGTDRRVRIIPGETVISRGLAQLPADSYLLDQSSSMSGSKWHEVQNYRFPRNSKIYTFTSESRTCGTNIIDESPMGNTPLYVSLAELIGKTEKSRKITALTDGMNNMGGSPQEIIRVANDRGIQVSFIGLDLPREAELELAEIATKTNGKVYLSK